MFGSVAFSEIPLGALPDEATGGVVSYAPVAVAVISAVGIVRATTEVSGRGIVQADSWAVAVIRADHGERTTRVTTQLLSDPTAHSSVLAVDLVARSAVLLTREAASQLVPEVVQVETEPLADVNVIVPIGDESDVS